MSIPTGMPNPSWAWQLGSPGTALYRLYDWLRRRLDQKLVNYLYDQLCTSIGSGTIDQKGMVLEAGSGPAYASSLFSQKPKIALSVAADLDIYALREAHRRDPHLPVVVADLNHLPFSPGCFDLTWNSSTLEHLQDPAPACKEMARVTRKQLSLPTNLQTTLTRGLVYIGVPFLYGPLGFQRLITMTRVGIWIGKAYSRRGLEKLLIQSGLQPISHIYYFFYFFIGILTNT